MKDLRETDLQELQARHALDDSLIESLLASKTQANAHLAFWIRTIWVVNGTLIPVLALNTGFALRHLLRGGPIWIGLIIILSVYGLLLVIGVLKRQRRATEAIKSIAIKHDLV